METGTLILLNGGSSAGKTSLARTAVVAKRRARTEMDKATNMMITAAMAQVSQPPAPARMATTGTEVPMTPLSPMALSGCPVTPDSPTELRRSCVTSSSPAASPWVKT